MGMDWFVLMVDTIVLIASFLKRLMAQFPLAYLFVTLVILLLV